MDDEMDGIEGDSNPEDLPEELANLGEVEKIKLVARLMKSIGGQLVHKKEDGDPHHGPDCECGGEGVSKEDLRFIFVTNDKKEELPITLKSCDYIHERLLGDVVAMLPEGARKNAIVAMENARDQLQRAAVHFYEDDDPQAYNWAVKNADMMTKACASAFQEAMKAATQVDELEKMFGAGSDTIQ